MDGRTDAWMHAAMKPFLLLREAYGARNYDLAGWPQMAFFGSGGQTPRLALDPPKMSPENSNSVSPSAQKA